MSWLFSILQILVVIAGLFFLYQCAVFCYHSIVDLTRGENGLTAGFLVLYVGMLLGGLWTAIEVAVASLNRVYGPFSFILNPMDVGAYGFTLESVRFAILLIVIIGNHILYFQSRKSK